jgi:hypothetical protein
MAKSKPMQDMDPCPIDVTPIKIEGCKKRYNLSPDKDEHMRLVIKILNERKKYWPLSVRGVHYPLLNHDFVRGYYAPQRKDDDWGGPKRVLKYANDDDSYHATANLLTRLRLDGTVPWEALDDPTRPLTAPRYFRDTRHFFDQEMRKFLRGYTRDLLQSQAKYIEVLCEKNTIYNMCLQVTRKYQIPTSSGRGFNSIDPWHDLYLRFKASGKKKLALIVASDYDPEGEMIPHDAGRHFRDDFGVPEENVAIIKAGVTRQQITHYGLQPMNFAKETSSNTPWFVERNGNDASVYELEALEPENMLRDLNRVILRVLDLRAFTREEERQAEDRERLGEARERADEALADFMGEADLEDAEDDEDLEDDEE